MDWSERLDAAIDYLERGLERDIEMEQAAALANCSLFHFMRMFDSSQEAIVSISGFSSLRILQILSA